MDAPAQKPDAGVFLGELDVVAPVPQAGQANGQVVFTAPPGCAVLADRCDLDHEVPWPSGATEPDNLYAKSRRCHNAKTAGLWASVPLPDGGLGWTTLAGREYVTYPKNWREGLRDTSCEPDARPHDELPPF